MKIANLKTIQSQPRKISLALVKAILVGGGLALFVFAPSAQAAGNLLSGSSFEGDINANWSTWSHPDSGRTYELYRAYDSAYGFGSYSAAIEASGEPTDPFNGLYSSHNQRNNFTVNAGENYFLIFYAKSTSNMDVMAYLQKTGGDYGAVTSFPGANISGEWQKFIFTLSPDSSGEVVLSFVIGDMPAGATLYLDGVSVVEQSLVVRTTEVKGSVGDNRQFIRVDNIGNFTPDDIRIELPYFDSRNNEAVRKSFKPEQITNSGVYMDFYESTFPGIGRVYVRDYLAGSFNYSVQPRLESIHPDLPRAGSDLAIQGNGFSPIEGQTFAVMNTLNNEGRKDNKWVAPQSLDARLTEAVFSLPTGIISGRLYIQTSYIGINGEEIVSNSNSTNYRIKPRITNVNWRQKGYEHVGDVLRVYGMGISNNPKVNFYDEEGNKVDTNRAQVLEIGDVEVIEVEATEKYNQFEVTVTSGGVESDPGRALAQSAKPKLEKIRTSQSRKLYASNNQINAASVGEEIMLIGKGFLSLDSETEVVFEGINGQISVPVAQEDIESRGNRIKVNVPAGAQSGYIRIDANGLDSNRMPLEVIPTVVSISPDPIQPGEDIVIRAYGVGNNLDSAKIHFHFSRQESETRSPRAIEYDGLETVLYVKAPLAVSSADTKVSLEYDHWTKEGEAALSAVPTILRAGINMDTKVLTITGYGFSTNPRENEITYQYADEDQTVIDPNVRVLGVYPTEEGQEIRVQIRDDYHYGFVSVTVNGQTSNQANFGPVKISRLARRVEFVPSVGDVQGVLYISGYNFGPEGGVKVGDRWADIHYRSDFFIIAVIDEEYLYENPVIIARQ